jgi:DNA-directed RNA polymerase specialized sigma24 family protein
MIATDSFVAVMARFDADADAAAGELFHRFADRLVALARRQFEPRLAYRVDPEEVVQSAFKSFFVRHRAGRFEVSGWPSVWGLLTVITLRKCADRVAYYRAACRDARREVDDSSGYGADGVRNREPSPDEAAVLAEMVDGLLASADPDDRPVLELSLQGYSAADISARLGRAVRSVHRIRERAHKHLLRLQANG